MALLKASIVIPCRNERDRIEACLGSILSSDLGDLGIEIIVVDGRSTDGTRAVLADYETRGAIRVIDNPRRITPVAMNLGIKAAQGEILLIMGAHAVYPRDYIRRCVEGLVESAADNVGGRVIMLPGGDSQLAGALAAVAGSRFGLGVARFRRGVRKAQEVDTVFGGCYRRELFAKIGGFDERLVRGQDRELNFRIRRAGGRILIFPEIEVRYYVRSKLLPFLRWVFASGAVPFGMSRVLRSVHLSWRNLVPLGFLCLSVLMAALIPVVGFPGMVGLLAILSSYFLVAVRYAGEESIRARRVSLLLMLPILFLVTHVTYALGSVCGALGCGRLFCGSRDPEAMGERR